MRLPEYTIAKVRGELEEAVQREPLSVLQAPPGSGKSTLVPLYLAELLHQGLIIVLQPRRAAVRAVGERVRSLAAGKYAVGWMTRDQQDVPRNPRILIMTEGIFVRRLIDDPEAAGTALVILDEFHERSQQADLSLVLARQAQELFAPQLRLLVMSATLETGWFAALGAPVIRAEQSLYEVAVDYSPPPSAAGRERALSGPGRPAGATQRIEEHAAAAACEEIRGQGTSGILIFLPGEREIQRCQGMLAQRLADPVTAGTVEILPLYGRQSSAEQQRALRPPSPGVQRIVIATNVAETSLTIEGISCVIDSGLRRRRIWEAQRGIGRMVTDRISAASAVQRAGRAGRLGPGRCLRLWPETEQLAGFDPPEVTAGDAAGLLLQLAAWGDIRPAAYDWPDPPPADRVTAAEEVLRRLDAIDHEGQLTPTGEGLQRLPLDVRLGAMVLHAASGADGAASQLRRAVALAAMLEDGDPLTREAAQRSGADLDLRLDLVQQALQSGERGGDGSRDVRPAAVRHIRREIQRIVRAVARLDAESLPAAARSVPEDASAGMLLACAYPDRIGRRSEYGSWQLTGGGEFSLRGGQAAWAPNWLLAADVQRGTRGGVINLAAALRDDEIQNICREDAVSGETVYVQDGKIRAREVRRLGEIVLSERPLQLGNLADPLGSLVGLVAREGVGLLGWSAAARRMQARLQFLHLTLHGPRGESADRRAGDFVVAASAARAVKAGAAASGADPDAAASAAAVPEVPNAWPDVSDAALARSAPDWLPGFLPPRPGVNSLGRVDMRQVLLSRIPWQLQQQIDELAPESVQLPSGSRQKLRYEGGRCVLSARIQQLFGMQQGPQAAGQPVEIELLSPARRPMQITRDLASFWRSTYAEIRKELRGRYPKHYWPEDPHDAAPTDRVRPR